MLFYIEKFNECSIIIIIVKFAHVDLLILFLHKNLAFSLTFNLVDLVSSLTNYVPHIILVANNCTSACKLVNVAMDYWLLSCEIYWGVCSNSNSVWR